VEQKSIISALTLSACTVSLQGAYFIWQILFVVRQTVSNGGRQYSNCWCSNRPWPNVLY